MTKETRSVTIKEVPEGITDEEISQMMASCIRRYYSRQLQPSKKKIEEMDKKVEKFISNNQK